MPEITDDNFAAQSQGVTPVFGLFGDYQDEQRSPKEMAYARESDILGPGATEQGIVRPEPKFNFQFSPDNALLELMNTKLAPPDPEAQAKAEKRLRNRTLFDAAGRLFTNIGDSMTLGAGGIPIKRAPSETDKKMMDYYKKIEEGLKANEDFKKEDFTRKLQSYGLWNQAKNQDRSFAQRDHEKDWQNYWSGRNFDQRESQYNRGLEHDVNMQDDRQGFEEKENAKERALRLKLQENNMYPTQYSTITKHGFPLELDSRDMPDAVSSAMNNKAFVESNPHLFYELKETKDADGNVTTVTVQKQIDPVEIVANYHRWIKKDQQAPSISEQQRITAEQKRTQAGTRSQPTVPAATQPQYSTGGWY